MELKKTSLAVLMGLGLGILTYFLLANLLLTAVVALAGALFLWKFIIPDVEKALTYLSKLDELHSFATSFVMQLSSTPSSFEALKICRPYFKKGVQEIYDHYGDDLEDFLNALDGFFQNQSYRVLAQLIRIYETAGGDIGQMCNSVLQDIAFKKTSAAEMFRVKKRKAAEFVTMWIFAFVSLVYLRIGLASYYMEMLEGNLSVAVFLVMVLFVCSSWKAFAGFRNISFEDQL